MDTRFFEVLRLIHSRLRLLPYPWVLTGSLGMALQGMPVAVHDVDLQTDRIGAYAIADRLVEFITQPVHEWVSERLRSHFGRLKIGGIQVEIMGDIQKWVDGAWEPPVDITRYRHWVDYEGLRLPVMDLAYEYQAYLKLGRWAKAAQIRAWLEAQGRPLDPP
ncbi:hypothetical protein QYE77_10190 [Thermanaerothrix sp. 4228-RoL]|uniref:Nucleotidyltransferase AbiEii toxin of type IV toxin-antitoxin system n=1 Tax=Thermanaerothrix solaris TaxID=3058434 RepID=A0ABU3NP69_9CHLR|nr:hypothetical protein [Thermanaerothrix sp. 4228-RoL]MDT8898640.1 hypothetical protein [Thermanaerothrix sp. 4228-RoL]